jgi:hypothetical protein
MPPVRRFSDRPLIDAKALILEQPQTAVHEHVLVDVVALSSGA